ncbi:MULTISPECIES: sugar ABC transporter ATP-binding protein [unclassified Acidisoma]|uniref:sugar ABC transporter ATP-binding protein n=1 Tax=unclassified Acidisoma TaxID=2634065 RepID=UPI00131BB897|nr:MULTISPECIES: sugar ABC transporter ATP-binding protein [unclassified Acidisoma]
MLSVSGISKYFPGVQALSDISLDVAAGEIHALVGENGAGKSTLTKVIAGVQPPDEGELRLDGRVVKWHGPAEAKAAGIHVIYQEFVLFPHLTVAENIFVGQAPRTRLGLLDRKGAVTAAREVLARLGVALDPQRLVESLTVADQQMVEIAKALIHRPKVLILDEPTAVIAGQEVVLLFERIRRLRDEGVAVIYISHRLEEIFQLCDQLTVIKDGRVVGSRKVSEVSRADLITMMVGRDLSHLFPPKPALTAAQQEPAVVLIAEGIDLGRRVRGAGLSLRAGTITGLAGLVGAGRSELAMAIFGGLPMDSGSVTCDGKTIRHMTPAMAISLGIGFVTEDRKGQGLAMLLDVAANITAASLGTVQSGPFLDRGKEQEVAESGIANYRVVCRGPSNPVATMSGGNQQKLLIARWARTCRRVLILDEPTRGVDVGARTEIYRIMRDLAAQGIAILMISSELPEVIGMSDSVYVMREGVIAGFLEGDAITEEAVMELATHHAQAA